MRSRFLGADGKMIAFDVDGYEFEGPWDSMVRVQSPLDGRSPDAVRTNELHVAHRGNYEGVIEEDMGGSIRQRLSTQGGEFIVSESPPEVDQCVAMWQGKFHEIATYAPNRPDADVASALAPLRGLRFVDSEIGLRVLPKLGSKRTVSVIEASNFVDGVGAIDVLPVSEVLGSVPAWSGLRVRAGELWKVQMIEEDDDEKTEYLQLATTSALVVITPAGFEKETGSSRHMRRSITFAEAVDRVAIRKG